MAESKIIVKARVTLVMTGYGDLTLTDQALVWNKAATSFLAFGAAAAATDSFVRIPLEEIQTVGKYTYFPGGGLVLTTKEGRAYKISFKSKKDFQTVFEYLTEHIKKAGP